MRPVSIIIKKSVLLILLSTFTGTAFASNPGQKLYMGIGISQTKLQTNEQNIRAISGVTSESTLQNSETGYTVYMGINLDQYLSIEMGYIDFGNYSVQTSTQKNKLFSANSLHITSALNYPITDSLNIYAKAGFSSWRTLSTDILFETDGTGLVYGAGLDINLYNGNHRTLQLEWLHQEFDNITLSNSDSITASLVFSF
ncbi:hypothetical protein MNBD_GAMMA09-306 [hydrothermal vent metagenome]|uniref:Outer membrane protein OmpA-like transmembrane domain-containing protein n=1 Tax=hydrothermal vent metagenome TaxID=652676 RepID=A0A3B0XK89_9ZZZZ